MSHDLNALFCAWGLDSCGQLIWKLFCCWSLHVTFGFVVLFCDGESGVADVLCGVDCMLSRRESLLVALESSVLGCDGISNCRPRSRVVIKAMTLHAWWQCWGRYLIKYPIIFSMGLTAWKSGWADFILSVKEAVNVWKVAYTCCGLWVVCGVT